MATSIVETVELKKEYGRGAQKVTVLKGIDLAISAGELVVIVGPSGAGKSTLLHLVGGLDWPTKGRVSFEGRDLYALSDRERSRIRNRFFGFVFQFYHLVPELTALENVMLPAWISKGQRLSKAEKDWAKHLLREVGLNHRAAHRPRQLSGGEQQRVAIARALMNRPKLIFCDEPTGNLDSENGKKILDLLVGFNRQEKTTFLIVTHEPALTHVAQRILSLKDGRLWA